MKHFTLLFMLFAMLCTQGLQAQEYNFQLTAYYYRDNNDSLYTLGETLASFNYSSANPAHAIFNDGIYFPASDCFGHNLWIRIRHIAADPNGTSVGVNVPQTYNNPCQSAIMIGGWAGFLYDFEIHRDINLSGQAAYFLGDLYPTSITVASLETLSGTCGSSEWLSFAVKNDGSTGWNLNEINFTGTNPNSNPVFSDAMAIYTTGGCYPPDGFSYNFPTGADSISFLNASTMGFSEFKMSAGGVSHFTYGYEYPGLSGGYQGMSMAFGAAPTFNVSATNITCLNGSDGQFNVDVTGGIGPFTYSWTSGNNSGTNISGLSPGTYYLTVIDQNGCGQLSNIELVINPPAGVTVALDSMVVTPVSCYGLSDGAIHLYPSGVGNLNYVWNDGSTESTIANLTANVEYTCTVSDQNSCAIFTGSVSQPDPLDLTTSVNGGTIQANSAVGAYQWINCDGNAPISGSIGATFTPTVTGDYSVQISYGTCVDTSACVNIIVSGIMQPEASAGLKLFPNPAEDELNIVIPENLMHQTLMITDAMGRVIRTTTIQNPGNVRIPVSGLPAGAYWIRCGHLSEKFLVN